MAQLSDPLQITPCVRLANRIVATAHGSGDVLGGLPTPGDAAYWRRVAEGGVAMAIVGGTVVAPESTVRRGNFAEAWRPEIVPGLRARANAISDAGAVPVLQLVHLGRETLGAERYHAPVAPSAVRSPREPTAPRALDELEVEAIVEAHIVSMRHALEAGFAGIELHAAHGYLLAQFLSSRTNRRAEADNVAGRATPVRAILQALRELDPAAVAGIRLSVGDVQDAGLDVPEIAELLGELEPVLDYLNLTVGMRSAYVRDMATETPPLLAATCELRGLTALPLLISHGFRDLPAMQRTLADGADMVGLARGLIADPDLPRKFLAGRPQTVRPCVACNEDCRAFDPTLLCSVNPSLAPPGRDRRPAAPLAFGRGPCAEGSLAIVGAGPGGLECALALADAGSAVTIWDAAPDLGGGLGLAGAAPHRSGWLRMIDFYRAALGTRVQWRLGETVTPSDLAGFDTVVAAIGATEDRPAGGFAWSSSEAIAAGPAVLRGAHRVVVVDDGFGWWPSVSAVELAVAAGMRDITLVTPGTAFATGIPAESRTQLLPRLAGVRLTIRPLCGLLAIGDGTVDVGPRDGEPERLATDAVIVVGERRSRDWRALVGEANGFALGDAVVPRRVAHAIAEGREAARTILTARAHALDRA
jgi:2,4-dienoyl-CoA reductase-like NADH-dependent reductase (Old Yellow Enzyme family)